MKSKDKNLYEYLMDMKGQLTIPIYQRNFSWEEKHYSQLFNDILEADGNNCEYNYITYVTIDYNTLEEKYYAKKKVEEICNDLNNMTGFQKVKCYRPY